MPRISDNIEDFILSTLGDAGIVNLSRNDLAQYFKCAPSQINYVLTTRFNINRGFVIESQRGGGGYIKVIKIKSNSDDYVKNIIDRSLSQEISFKDATYLLEDLTGKGFLTKEQSLPLMFAISDKSLANPIRMEDKLRASILRNTFINMLRLKGNT